MHVFKSRDFGKWTRKLDISDENLLVAIHEMNHGLYETNLGGSVYKKRLAYGNRGKRRGVRIVVAFLVGKKAFFMYGFSKNRMSNITQREEEALKELAVIYFNFSDSEIERAIKAGELIEVRQ